MKRLWVILPVLLIVGCLTSKKEYDENNIILTEFWYRQKFSNENVNGKVYRMVDSVKIYLGEMKDGQKVEEWVDWYENGQMKFQGTFKDGWQDGKSIYFNEDGEMTDEKTYKMGKLHGEWIKRNGWIVTNSKETFKDGIQDGLSTYWHKGGELGSRGNYKNGKKDGLWTHWYVNPGGFLDDSKKYIEEFYKNGKLNRLTTSWYRSGDKKREGTYIDGKKEGTWIEFYKTGLEKRKKNFKNGETISETFLGELDTYEITFRDGEPWEGKRLIEHRNYIINNNKVKERIGVYKFGNLLGVEILYLSGEWESWDCLSTPTPDPCYIMLPEPPNY